MAHVNYEAYRYYAEHSQARINEVCARAGIKPQTFSMLRRGHCTIRWQTAVALEEASRYFAERPEDYMRAERLLELERAVEQRQREMTRSTA